MGLTLAEKVWNAHIVHAAEGEPDLLYIDLHLIHEVTSPQAFDGLRQAGRPVRRTDLTLATEDHNVPTLFTETRDGGTRMTLRNRGQPSGFTKVAAPVLARAMRRAMTKDLERLSAVLQRRA